MATPVRMRGWRFRLSPRFRTSVPGTPALLLFISCAFVPPARAQYFGQNKVQYESFDFRVLETEHFDVYFYPEAEEAANLAGRLAERWYRRLSALLDHELEGRQPLLLYASHPDFEQTNALYGSLGEGTGGVTEALKRRIVLPLAGPLRETDHVIGHELVHAFQYDITGEGRGPLADAPSVARFPLWFVEGMAEYLSIGPLDAQTAMWMRDAVANEEKFPGFRQLARTKYFPYRYGHAFLAYLGGTFGDEQMGALLRAPGRKGTIEASFERVLGVHPDSLGRAWQREMRDVYEPMRERLAAPDAYGPPVFRDRDEYARLQVGPVLSPDGERMLLFSERDIFAVNLFLVDVQSGEILRRIVRAEVDPHFESLLFIRSAGAWSPDGHRIAFPAISSGRPMLVLADAESGDRIREVRFESEAGDEARVGGELGEITSPSWSPDGRFIVFSALAGGLTDLFLYDLETDALVRLTDDPFADLQPAWSPDGSKLAFVTDRFTTDLEDLELGAYEIALLDLANLRAGVSGIRPGDVAARCSRLPNPEGGSSRNPQWSPDGAALYFVADPLGIANLYRLELGAESAAPITNLYSGVSGITDLSPALSVSAAGNAVFTVFEKGGYVAHRIDDLASLPAVRVVETGGAAETSGAMGAIDAAGADTTTAGAVGTPGTPAAADTADTAGTPAAADTADTPGTPGSTDVRISSRIRQSSLPDTLSRAVQRIDAATAAMLRSSFASLPPRDRAGSRILYYHNLHGGAADPDSMRVHPYHPRLSLDAVGQPYIAAGVDPYGSYLGGGASLYFSDMLGNRNLSATIEGQTGGGFDALGASVSYVNLSRRTNWGVAGGQTPYLTGSFDAFFEVTPDDTLYIEREILYIQTNRSLLGLLSYPLNRAQRFELAAGIDWISFRAEESLLEVNAVTGEIVTDATRDLDAPGSLGLGEMVAAHVYDTSIFGGTSPILGQRSRLELAPTVGSLSYYTALADVRRYETPVRPFTLAGRALLYGRHGEDAEDDRLSTYYLGQQGFLRGYPLDSFSASELGPTTQETVFDRLEGTRLVVLNAELRFPPLALFGRTYAYTGPLPLELGVFYDAGVAWERGENPEVFGGDVALVRSYGAVGRVNLLGYAVLELDLAKPIDRPDDEWRWQFGLTAGY